MEFSSRSDFGPEESPFGSALRQARLRGGLLDLTVSNPTACGFDYSPEILVHLSNPATLRYHPDPLGRRSAREAVAAFCSRRYGADVQPDQVLLTASTSEAYSYLLRLFCDPGDTVLVPTPSYPLFDLLLRMHDVEQTAYPLRYHDCWEIDAEALRAAVVPRTRALVAVHPNNPTGHYCGRADRAALLDLAEARGLPLLVDEVFLDYPVEGEGAASFMCTPEPKILTAVMGGMSKLLCLPQMKVAWTVLQGPAEEVREAMTRLETIADTFLSVATPQQLALPAWLAAANAVQQQVLARVRANLSVLDQLLIGTTANRLRVEGGWCAVLRVPAREPDTEEAIRLLELGLATHPGSFFGFPVRGWLVVSLLVQPEVFQQGILRLLEALG